MKSDSFGTKTFCGYHWTVTAAFLYSININTLLMMFLAAMVQVMVVLAAMVLTVMVQTVMYWL